MTFTTIDSLVYTLAGKVGGRSEVINAPMYDILGYLLLYFEEKEQEAKRVQNEIIMNHMSRLHSQKAESKQQQKANKDFLERLMNESKREKANDDKNIKNKIRDKNSLSWGIENEN